MKQLEGLVNLSNYSIKEYLYATSTTSKNSPLITKLSPTLFATLKQCPLRAGIRQAKAQQTTRSSTAALLGTIAHRVLEKAEQSIEIAKITKPSRGTLDQIVREMEAELQTSRLDRHLLPIRKWKKYFLLRERTIRRCEDICQVTAYPEHKLSQVNVNLTVLKMDLRVNPILFSDEKTVL